MIIDATFWVAISFVIFVGILIYFKIPQKVDQSLLQDISNIKNQIEKAEELKEEAKNILSDNEKKLSNSKGEIQVMINQANNLAEKNVIKANKEFHLLMENRKRNAEQKIRQMKDQALRDIRNSSIKIALISVENLVKKSVDKSKLDKMFLDSIEETKLALKKKSS
tara:strand:- start:1496 stop:1993 length:498 start_codon:yes stop_codon:yes gene_type:complete